MELDLSSKLSHQIFQGEGGSYHAWSSHDIPLLKEAKLGAGKLVLKPLGFAVPHYADSSKIGYVVEGKGMAGLIHPQDCKEKIVTLQKGDFIQVPLGVVSWWYNDDSESELAITFLGDTSSALEPGGFTYFFLTGSASILTGFSTEVIAKSLGAGEEQSKKLIRNQPIFTIIKLPERLLGLKPSEDSEEAKGRVSEEGGFCVQVVELDCDAIWEPRYVANMAVQAICVIKGSGRFQIVGSEGKCVLDEEMKEGEVFVVPRFFSAAAIAGGGGMEWFSITTSPKPVYGCLTGKSTSLLGALSPQILGASLNVDQDLLKILSPKK